MYKLPRWRTSTEKETLDTHGPDRCNILDAHMPCEEKSRMKQKTCSFSAIEYWTNTEVPTHI